MEEGSVDDGQSQSVVLYFAQRQQQGCGGCCGCGYLHLAHDAAFLCVVAVPGFCTVYARRDDVHLMTTTTTTGVSKRGGEGGGVITGAT